MDESFLQFLLYRR